MKKPREVRRLILSRETLANLDRLDGALLGRVAGGSAPNICTGGSSCFPHCTCPPPLAAFRSWPAGRRSPPAAGWPLW
jgi:hypothetical protein